MIQSSSQPQNKSIVKKNSIRKDAVDILEQEQKIRPSKLDEMIGRAQEKRTLKMMIDSAKKRKEVVDHILFYGPPGLG